MKLFSIFNKKHDGILQYLYRNNQFTSNSISITGTKDNNWNDPIELIKSPNTASVHYTNSKTSNAYIKLDLGENNKAIITDYQIQTIEGSSPPTSWNLTAYNIENETVTIHNKYDFKDICELKTQGSYWTCARRTIVNLKVDNPIGPFRYFKFNVYNNMRGVLFPEEAPVKDIRIGGFEIYGALKRENDNLFNIITFGKTCPKVQHLLYVTIIEIIVVYKY